MSMIVKLSNARHMKYRRQHMSTLIVISKANTRRLLVGVYMVGSEKLSLSGNDNCRKLEYNTSIRPLLDKGNLRISRSTNIFIKYY